MSALGSQFNLSVENYAERARLVTALRDGCARAERGERVDLHQITEKLNGLVHALNNDLIAMGNANVSRKLHNEIQAHKKKITGLTARVKVLSAKENYFPAWVKPVGLTILAVGGGLAITVIAASRFASSSDASYTGISKVLPTSSDRISTGREVTPAASVVDAIDRDTLERAAKATDGRFEADQKPGQDVSKDPLDVSDLDKATIGESQNPFFKLFKFIQGSNERAGAIASYFVKPLDYALSELKKYESEELETILKSVKPLDYAMTELKKYDSEELETILKIELTIIASLVPIAAILIYKLCSYRLHRPEINFELLLNQYFNEIQNLPPLQDVLLSEKMKRLDVHNQVMQRYLVEQGKNFNFELQRIVVERCESAGLFAGFVPKMNQG